MRVAVGVAGDAGKRLIARPAQQQLWPRWTLRARAVLRFLPEVAQGVELLDEPPAARGVADPRRVVVLLARADRDAQREAPAGERVEAGGGLGEGGWRVERADEDVGGDAYARGDGGDGGERGQGVEAVVDEAVERGERREGSGVGAPRPVEREAGRGAGDRRGQANADAHRVVTPDVLLMWSPLRLGLQYTAQVR